MIGVQTELQVADNTGAKRIECIKVLGGWKEQCNHVLDLEQKELKFLWVEDLAEMK